QTIDNELQFANCPLSSHTIGPPPGWAQLPAANSQLGAISPARLVKDCALESHHSAICTYSTRHTAPIANGSMPHRSNKALRVRPFRTTNKQLNSVQCG